MTNSLEREKEKLSKILRLEAEKYQDQAVIGGLARYAETWIRETRAASSPEMSDWIQEVADRLRAYSSLPDLAARQEAVTLLRKIVQAGPSRPPSQQKRTEERHTTARAPTETEPTPASSSANPTPTSPASPHAHTGLDSSVTVLRGVGPRQAQRLAKLDIHTIRDMLYFFPRRYDDYSKLKPINRLEYDEEVTIIARVRTTNVRKTRGGTKLFQTVLTDGTGSIKVTWFNQPYLADKIKRGQQIVISGKVDEYLGQLCFNSPQWEPLEQDLLHTARLVPVYPLTEGIHARWLRRLVKRTVDYWSKRLPDHLPDSVRQEENLLDLETAIVQAYFPDSQELLEQARYLMAFDELFVLQIGLLRQRHMWRSEPGKPLAVDDATIERFVGSLAFELTHAQQRALKHIVSDLRSDRPMNRLLQGDVGSGKTVVAAAAMALTVASGAQAAMMAPTEILAEQHHNTLTQIIATAWYASDTSAPAHGPLSTKLVFDALQRIEQPLRLQISSNSRSSVQIHRLRWTDRFGLVDARERFDKTPINVADQRDRGM
jgi:ATP-dependent DNA helicase RecG